MSSYERKLVHDIVAARGFTSESQGEGRDRHTVITRVLTSSPPLLRCVTRRRDGIARMSSKTSRRSATLFGDRIDVVR